MSGMPGGMPDMSGMPGGMPDDSPKEDNVEPTIDEID
jgi:hypothetical protein